MNTQIVRTYNSLIADELRANRQIVFLSGPRQVGKTTLARRLLAEFGNPDNYLNWDDFDHRQIILEGTEAVIDRLGLDRLQPQKPLVVFDELHKFRHWKTFLKGFFDRFEERLHVLVTGSSRMDLFRKGGDSLMGRYFRYRLHPLSVRELIGEVDPDQLIQRPVALPKDILKQLIRFGGFPEPFLKANSRFFNRWQSLRREQLLREDIRDITRIQEIAQLEVLVQVLAQHAGQETKYSTLARRVRVSVDTIRRWLDTLESFYCCFRIRPWHRNLTTALRKEPRTYLWDWSLVHEEGLKAENFIASHLLKAVHWWTDLGHGQFDLYYLRTKEGREVDFLVTRDHEPWFIVEVKSSASKNMNPNLPWFQKRINAVHAFQVCLDEPYIEADCFSETRPVKVPAVTFLSQLV